MSGAEVRGWLKELPGINAAEMLHQVAVAMYPHIDKTDQMLFRQALKLHIGEATFQKADDETIERNRESVRRAIRMKEESRQRSEVVRGNAG